MTVEEALRRALAAFDDINNTPISPQEGFARAHAKYIDAMESARAALAAAENDGWQPIETAPKDGSSIMLFPHFIVTHWDGEEEMNWAGSRRVAFTHWRPLPAPPSEG